MSQNPSRNESPSVHITHATTYATLAMAAQALVMALLPAFGVHLSSVVVAAIISVLVGGGTVVLHMAGLAVPGAPPDAGRAELRDALRTLLVQEGPALLDYLTRTRPAPPPVLSPDPAAVSTVPLAAAAMPSAPEPTVDLSWGGPLGPRQPLGAGPPQAPAQG